MYEGGYVKTKISFVSLIRNSLPNYLNQRPSLDFSLNDLASSMVGDEGIFSDMYQESGFGEIGHLKNRAHILQNKEISKADLIKVFGEISETLGISPSDSVPKNLPFEDICYAFHKFRDSTYAQVANTYYSEFKDSIKCVFFKNDPPARECDISSAIHDYSLFVCRPPVDTTFDLLRHYGIDMTLQKVQWHIKLYRSQLLSFLKVLPTISSDMLQKIKIIEFPVLVSSSSARHAILDFLLAEDIDSSILSKQSQKFDPSKSLSNVNHGSNLPDDFQDLIRTNLLDTYEEFLAACDNASILVKG